MQQCFKALLLTDETFQHQELKAFGYIHVWPNGKLVKKKSLQLGVLTLSHSERLLFCIITKNQQKTT